MAFRCGLHPRSWPLERSRGVGCGDGLGLLSAALHGAVEIVGGTHQGVKG